MDLSQYFDSWPPKNVAAAIVGKHEATYGDIGRCFELMSVTKPLAAYAFLVAVEEGIMELDQPAGPEGSTVRHLLAHASGLNKDVDKPQRKPEERRIYSPAAGFEVLRRIVEEESGFEFGDYAREAVFEPLGMSTANIWGTPGYEGSATIKDAMAFIQELIAPKLLAEETVREAFSMQFPDLIGIVPGYGMQQPNPWGLGFEIKGTKAPHWTADNLPEDTVGHFGMKGTFLWVVPSWSDHPLAGTGMAMFSDKDFGDWAKPLWQDTNTAIVAELLNK